MRGRHKHQGEQPASPSAHEIAFHQAQDLLLMHGPLSEDELRSFYHQALYIIARHGVMTLGGVRAAIVNARSDTPLYLETTAEQANLPAEEGEKPTSGKKPTLVEMAKARYTIPTESAAPEPAPSQAE